MSAASTACTSSTASTARRTACPQAKYRRGAPVPPRYSRTARPATLVTSAQPGQATLLMYSSDSGSPVSQPSRKAPIMSCSHCAR